MYLDNAATTKVHTEVSKAMEGVPFANYNAKYYKEAQQVKDLINSCIENVSNNLKVHTNQIVFTSSATEANNYIIKGVFAKYPNAHFITSKREHKSVLAVFEYLEKLGAEVSYIKTTDEVITINHVKEYIKDNTKFVSIMSVNNETGIINDVENIAKELRELQILFHTDAVQALGKVKLNYELFDFVSLSAHKISGPKGIGLAIISEKIEPLLHGSNQQNGNRAGTLPNELIVGFDKAIDLAINEFEINQRQILESYDYIKKFLEENLGDDVIYNFPKTSVRNILSFRIKGEINQIFLEENKDIIKASTGSSCSIGEPSYVLKEHGFQNEQILNTIRISLSMYDKLY